MRDLALTLLPMGAKFFLGSFVAFFTSIEQPWEDFAILFRVSLLEREKSSQSRKVRINASIVTMRSKYLQRFIGKKTELARFFFVAGLLYVSGYFQGFGQNKEALPSGVKKETSNSGYLSKSIPSGLRFAVPPKPPVAYLPPLPISYDPQPVFNPEFSQPIPDFPVPSSTPTPPVVPVATVVPFTELTTIFTNKHSKVPETPIDPGVVNPQMLVRFFASGKPGSTPAVASPVEFRVPVKEEKHSSSASYELK